MHGIRGESWRKLSSRRFFELVERLPYYDGVVRARFLAAVKAERNAVAGQADLAALIADGDLEIGNGE